MICLHKGYKSFLTGSRKFFNGLDGFEPHDADYIRIFENQPFGLIHLKPGNGDAFCYGDVSKILDVIKTSTTPQTVVTLLVPEIAELLNLESPKVLDDFNYHFENLKPKHAYLKFIKDCYISNNAWILTDEQRLQAFKLYQESK